MSVFVSVCLSVSASKWEELSPAGPERGSVEDSLLRGLEQLVGGLCLQAAGILQVLTAACFLRTFSALVVVWWEIPVLGVLGCSLTEMHLWCYFLVLWFHCWSCQLPGSFSIYLQQSRNAPHYFWWMWKRDVTCTELLDRQTVSI